MQRNRLNILTPDLAPSQKNYYLIDNINKVGDNSINIQVFTENISRFCMKPRFSVMNISEAWAQAGPFVCTNLSTASKLINYPVASRKLFYIWDLEFLRGDKRIYEGYSPIYLHKELELVCRSEDHRLIVENCFNREVKYIVDNFNIYSFLEIVE